MGNIFGKNSSEHGRLFHKFGKSNVKEIEEQHRLLYNRTSYKFQVKHYPEELENLCNNESVFESSSGNIPMDNSGEGCSYTSSGIGCNYNGGLFLEAPRMTHYIPSKPVKRKREEEDDTDEESDEEVLSEKKISRCDEEEQPHPTLSDQNREIAPTPMFSCFANTSIAYEFSPVSNDSCSNIGVNIKRRSPRGAALRARTKIRNACCKPKDLGAPLT